MEQSSRQKGEILLTKLQTVAVFWFTVQCFDHWTVVIVDRFSISAFIHKTVK